MTNINNLLDWITYSDKNWPKTRVHSRSEDKHVGHE